METMLPTVADLDRDATNSAVKATVYQSAVGTDTTHTVVELHDAHQRVLARTVVDAAGEVETIADRVLQRSPLERCGPWAAQPLQKRRWFGAPVTPRVSTRMGSFESERLTAQHGFAL